jgi:hypothetical protein
MHIKAKLVEKLKSDEGNICCSIEIEMKVNVMPE